MTTLITTKGIIKYQDIGKVLTDDKPIIFWDTCSLLYFNTIIKRRAYDEFVYDEKLADLVLKGKVYSVTSSLVFQEYTDHHDDFKIQDAEQENKLKIAMQQYGQILGGQKKIDLQTGMNALQLSTYMDQMVCKLWENTYVIDDDESFLKKAHNRVISCEAPSSHKSQEYKDCYIWETFLSLCDNTPYKNQSYFMTENTDDYCGKNSKIPLPDIQKDLTNHQGEITTTKSKLKVTLERKLGIIPPANPKLNAIC